MITPLEISVTSASGRDVLVFPRRSRPVYNGTSIIATSINAGEPRSLRPPGGGDGHLATRAGGGGTER